MSNEQENEIKKKWDIHCAHVERTNLVKCLDDVLDTIKNSDLELRTKKTLSTFYNELRTYYASPSIQDLVNNAKMIHEYSETYLANHNMLLIVGVLTQQRLDSQEIRTAVETLQQVPSQLREQSTSLIQALQQIEPYAIQDCKKLDEDFYGDEENTQHNKCR